MTPTWITPAEALRYFGLGEDVEELERIVIEYHLDAEVDEQGNLTAIDTTEAAEALFAEHERSVGYRPDDPAVAEQIRVEKEAEEIQAKQARQITRSRLENKVTTRRQELRVDE